MSKKQLLDLITCPYLRFGRQVSRQDLLKAVALYIMIIDHIGMFFFPDNLAFRVVGRTTLPVWFFLLGFNFRNHKKVIDLLLLAAIFLEGVSWIIGKDPFPLNALVSMVFCRWILSLYQAYIRRYNQINVYEWLLLLVAGTVLYPFSNSLFEYGALAIVMALWGYNSRNHIGHRLMQTISMAVAICVTQLLSFNFSMKEAIVCAVLLCSCIYTIHNYQAVLYNIKGIGSYVINISSRYTLYLYVIHLLALRLIIFFC